jgi:hypothetical protein
MGNQQSNPFQSLIAQAQKGVPKPVIPDPRAEIETKRVELTMSKNDTKVKQDNFDKLVPDEVTQKKTAYANEQLNKYSEETRRQFNIEIKLFDQTLQQLESISNSPTYALAQKYKDEMKRKHERVAQEYTLNKEKAFTNRRRFLDSEPQSGVYGLGWFQTVDDQILAVFWLAYILFIGTALIMALMHFGPLFLGSIQNIAIIGTTAFFFLIFVAHASIKAFAAV